MSYDEYMADNASPTIEQLMTPEEMEELEAWEREPFSREIVNV